ncbi:putative codeine 3-O-demethylase [Lupinus albus]|uniref:Putative codeine 3-O-demethylase n=1 Tax=Lupinus albus TaxID=3870 RepID=A0A6A4PLI7_LUPAL|nr:putative codeine 3-O-demethylase [Lupinus albus]
MANNLIISKEKSLPRSIQEMSIDGDEPPSQFIVTKNSIWSKDTSTNIQIPIIDLSLLSSSEAELDKLRFALSSAGCFQAIGHGMSSSYLEKVREVAKQFFALPDEEKEKYARPVGESEGYGSDRIVSEKQVLDWSYRLSLRVLPTEKRRLSLWPKIPSDFSDTLEEFTAKVKSMMDYLSRSMAESLNLEEGSFLDQFGEKSLMLARFNFYPCCSRPDLVLGVKPHTDRSGITVLLQDTEVEGLQILVDDTWVNVPTIPDALVVNLGDQMQIMSNGIFKSPMHRVVTNTEKLRISVAMFNEPEPENEIGPVEGLIDETRPRLYRNIKNYGDINYRSYQEGKIALEMVRIEDNSH